MRRVALIAFDDVQHLDVAGPAEVFSLANRHAGGDYALELLAPGGERLRTSSGLVLVPDRELRRFRGAADTIVVAGGRGTARAERDEALIAWLRRAAPRARRVTSVCTGAFLLARAGLLDGRRATTHWSACAELAHRYPAIAVDPEPIYVRDGKVATSAGVTAGMDLALALVEEDLGAAAALLVARSLVLFVRRPGGQSQFSAQLRAQPATRAPLRELQGWIADHLDADLSVPALAVQAAMSERHLARTFREETGMTPAAYVEAARLERARAELESTGLAVEAVAARCGFGTTETMRRAFARRLGVSPSQYRARFRPARAA